MKGETDQDGMLLDTAFVVALFGGGRELSEVLGLLEVVVPLDGLVLLVKGEKAGLVEALDGLALLVLAGTPLACLGLEGAAGTTLPMDTVDDDLAVLFALLTGAALEGLPGLTADAAGCVGFAAAG